MTKLYLIDLPFPYDLTDFYTQNENHMMLKNSKQFWEIDSYLTIQLVIYKFIDFIWHFMGKFLQSSVIYMQYVWKSVIFLQWKEMSKSQEETYL